MFDLVVSKDYKKMMQENQIELTDWDKATLIYNHPSATYIEKMWELLALKKQTEDEILKEQIDERLSHNHEFYEKYKKNFGNAYYELITHCNGEDISRDIYKDFESAHKDGMKRRQPFQITKALYGIKIFETEDEEKEEVLGIVEFDREGYPIKYLWLYKSMMHPTSDSRKGEQRFEDRYVKLPLLFRQGDIVHKAGTEIYGIVNGPIDDAEESRYRNWAGIGKGYYTDFQVPVKLIYNGQKILPIYSYEHIHPTELEYAKLEEDDRRNGFLKYMRDTLYKRGSFSLFSSAGREKGRDRGRISAVLSNVESVWRRYPDMRLGQLLLCVCGNQDFFSMEDEELMEKLRYNQALIGDKRFCGI